MVFTMGLFRALCILLTSMSGVSLIHIEEASGVVQVTPSKGEAWPMPQAERKHATFYTYNPTQFEFRVINQKCELLTRAIERYKTTLKNFHGLTHKYRKSSTTGRRKREPHADSRHLGNLVELLLNLTEPCEHYPSFKMDESYMLRISSTGATLASDSIWGILRGMETVSQLFYVTDDFTEVRINCTEIFDFPHYFHRGLLLDTARHYISVPNLLQTLDAMAMNKLNVFHWHITDDQSFPYQSAKFPELSKAGAYHPTMVYTMSNVATVVEYARERGIRVIPEFDLPGHTRSWGKSHPLILAQCYKADEQPRPGPLHPLRKSTYKLLQQLFQELQSLFPDKYFHVGGDEVEFECWESNPDIKRFIAYNNLRSVEDVFIMFMSKVFTLMGNRTVPIFWQETYENGITPPPGAIVQIWKGSWKRKIAELVNKNISVILSNPWYLNSPKRSYSNLYKQDPRTHVAALVPRSLLTNIVGGEACMWSEEVNDFNLHAKIWPKASVVAEVLWSVTKGQVTEEFPARLEEQACRMQRRGIPTEPATGPGFCLV